MAITFTNQLPADGNTFSIFGAVADVTKFSLVDVKTAGNTASADYVFAEGDVEYPTTMHVRINTDMRSGSAGVKRISIRLKSWVQEYDDVAERVSFHPIEMVMAWNVPGNSSRDLSGLRRMCGTLASLWGAYDDDSWIASNALIVKPEFGIPSIL